jgi:hypothetical protein
VVVSLVQPSMASSMRAWGTPRASRVRHTARWQAASMAHRYRSATTGPRMSSRELIGAGEGVGLVEVAADRVGARPQGDDGPLGADDIDDLSIQATGLRHGDAVDDGAGLAGQLGEPAGRAATVLTRSSASDACAPARHPTSREPVRQTGHRPSPSASWWSRASRSRSAVRIAESARAWSPAGCHGRAATPGTLRTAGDYTDPASGCAGWASVLAFDLVGAWPSIRADRSARRRRSVWRR